MRESIGADQWYTHKYTGKFSRDTLMPQDNKKYSIMYVSSVVLIP